MGGSTDSPSCRRLGWASLLARVFAVDVMRCPSCGGRLGLVAVLSDPASIGRYLSGVGLAADSPAVAATRLRHSAIWTWFFELDYSVFVVRRPLR